MGLITGSFILLIAGQFADSSRCSGFRDCLSCTAKRVWYQAPCRWCPLDKTCHTKWSPRNHCLQHQNIERQTQCARLHRGNTSYSVDEAYKLAQFSALAYSDDIDGCLGELIPYSDYTIFSVLSKDCDDFLFDYDKKCLALVAFSHRYKDIVVSFRGTRGTKQVIDQVLTVLGTPSVSSGIGGKVQRYFKNVNSKFYHSIKYILQDLLQRFPDYIVKVTGHSLGGAVASITSAKLVKDNVLRHDQIVLYTFGMPRVGNKRYALAHDRLVPNSWRVVRDGDAVAMLPTCRIATCSLFNGPYHHGKKVLYLGERMDRYAQYVICKGNEDSKSVCLRHQRVKRHIVKKIGDKHKIYFGIPIGTYCNTHLSVVSFIIEEFFGL